MARKSDLVDKISKELNYLSKEDIKDSIDLVFDYLQFSLAKQNRIEIRGFGSFLIRERKFPNSERSYKTVYYRGHR
ncbi:MAG: HU family DNA-binding protein [Rickettsia sp.]|jgi:nucleoid DNA-binding protein|nr:HU family DNA-binding protein [Rickettsia sp.]